MPSTETSACCGASGILRGYEEEEEEEEDRKLGILEEGGLSPGNLARFVPFAITALISQSVPYKTLNIYHKPIISVNSQYLLLYWSPFQQPPVKYPLAVATNIALH
jgi:hypothetical protein